MSYNVRINWKDHVVERPRTYMESQNADGSKTFTAAPGEVLQQGTAQSAENFNTMEEALQHLAIAYDLLLCDVNAELMDIADRLEALEAKA